MKTTKRKLSDQVAFLTKSVAELQGSFRDIVAQIDATKRVHTADLQFLNSSLSAVVSRVVDPQRKGPRVFRSLPRAKRGDLSERVRSLELWMHRVATAYESQSQLVEGLIAQVEDLKQRIADLQGLLLLHVDVKPKAKKGRRS